MDKLEQFLKQIKQVESSGGKDTEHRTMESGIHAGDAAIGSYGLMPNTIDELVKRSGDPNLKHLLKMNGQEKKEYIKNNPKLEERFAKQLAAHVLNKQGGDFEKAAYTWLYGHNMTPDRVEAKDYENDPYVQKFRKAASIVKNPNNKPYFNIDNTPEGNDLVKYLSRPEKNPFMSYDQLNDAYDKIGKDIGGVEELKKSVLYDDLVTPEEKDIIQKKENNDYIRDSAMGGLSSGGIVNVGKALAPQFMKEIPPLGMKGFDKLRKLIRPDLTPNQFIEQMARKPLTQDEFINLHKNIPSVKEILKDPRKYNNTPLTNDLLQHTPLDETAVEQMKNAAKYIDEDTLKSLLKKK